jgi:hypothetical protein
MIKYVFYVLLLITFCVEVNAQSPTPTPTTKYILDDNDIFKQGFFTINNTALLYDALNIADLLKFTTAPLTATSPGVAGQIAYQDNFLYICIENNNWRRIRMGTW